MFIIIQFVRLFLISRTSCNHGAKVPFDPSSINWEFR